MLTITDAQVIALQLYGVKGTCTKLPGEHDANFYVQAACGKEYLLKISRPDEDANIIAMQNAVLQHLHHEPQTFTTPVLHHADNGEFISRHHDNKHVRLFSFIPDRLFASVSYHSRALLASLGNQLAHLTRALQTFQHPAAKRTLKWDLQHCDWLRDHLNIITDASDRECVEHFLQRYDTLIKPEFENLRHSVIHGDVNDYNILVKTDADGETRVSGFIDFGDMVESATICELAIAAAYAMFAKPDPLAAATEIIQHYHAVFPLRDNELHVLFDLICMRLCTSVINSAMRKRETPDDPYLVISEQPAWELLRKLRVITPQLAHYTFRAACQLEPCPQTPAITNWLTHADVGPLFKLDLARAKKSFLDLSPSSLEAQEIPDISFDPQDPNQKLAIGQYNEARMIYSNDQYQIQGNHGSEARTVHIGLDIFIAPGTELLAPLAGVIHSLADNNQPQDYGPTVIIEHILPNADTRFYTLYGHLSRETLQHLKPGQAVAKGQRIGWIGDHDVNGGWVPHLHLQLITDILDKHGDFPGVAQASKRALWLSLCPDANLLARIPEQQFPPRKLSQQELRKQRKHYFANNLGLSYQEPLQIVRGSGQYLFDENGHRYLDCVNNIAHVGHCHPRVVAAAHTQAAILNTNTRYLHPYLTEFAEQLIATLPEPLEVCFFVNSGSEANELALRLAETHTGKREMLVLDHGYHGNTAKLIDISPYKFKSKGGKGKPDFVHVLPLPARASKNFDVVVPPTIAAFIGEALPSCAGQIVLPDDYLKTVYAAVREVGGVCIADEVQTGLGRVGSHFYAFETQGVIPDIVTLGKPLGNGHPLAAVITTREIADSFNNGMEYFNSFGGNPVSCAIGLAVLNVIRDENLTAHAASVGSRLMQQLTDLQTKFQTIKDVRGLGLFLGIEFFTPDTATIDSATYTRLIVERMKDRNILLSVDGPLHNVIKIKPPLAFDNHDSDTLVQQLHAVLDSIDIDA